MVCILVFVLIEWQKDYRKNGKKSKKDYQQSIAVMIPFFFKELKGVSSDQWPLSGLERVTTCPVCGCEKRNVLYRNLRDRTFFTAPGTWILFRCSSCRVGYLDPRPTEETIGLAYQEYYTHRSSNRESYGKLGFYHRIRRVLANGYRNYQFGFREKPSHPAGAWIARLLPTMKRALDGEMRHLPRSKPGSRLLDVGCGNGDFLIAAKKAGWQVEGLDLDRRAVTFCLKRGLQVTEGTVLDIKKKAGFHGITMRHVIEHVHDPCVVLRRCWNLLIPGGWVWIETPNLDSLNHRRFQDNWAGLDPPRHLLVFTRRSLINLLEQTGFQKFIDMPYRPLFAQTSKASIAIQSGQGLPKSLGSSRADRWFFSLLEWRARFQKNVRETVVLRAFKPSQI
jgi:2-polyprenyl-3-methyl-5-hydroxy-6-metoxy-1,4-benzoquinol methylase